MPFKSKHPQGSRKEQISRFLSSVPKENLDEALIHLVDHLSRHASRKDIDSAIHSYAAMKDLLKIEIEAIMG